MSTTPSESARDDKSVSGTALTETYAGFLSSVPIFAGMDRQARARVAAYLEALEVADGAVVIREGDPPDGLYLVHEGRFSVMRSVASAASEVRLSSCGPGETFGEIGLITGERRSASVRADGNGRVLRLDQVRFRDLVQRDPSVALAIAVQLIRQLRVADIARSESYASRESRTRQRMQSSDLHDLIAGPLPPKAAPTLQSPTKGRFWRKAVGVALALAVYAAGWLVGPPAGLDLAGWRAMLAVIATVPLFATAALPDGAVALFLVGAWTVGGVSSTSTALSGFASPTWLLTLSILAIATAVAATGIIFRVALFAGTHAPGGFAGQVVALVVSGLLVSTAFPESTGRTALVAVATGDLAEAMGHVPGSRAATGIAMAIFVGFGLTTAPFLTSSSTALLTYTLLPDQARNGLDWAGWALRAAPVYLVLMAGLISGLIWLYRPEPVAPDAPSVDSARRRSRVALQSALLGRPSRNEQLSGIVVLLLVAGFLTGPIHHIPPTWLALAAVLLLAVVGVVTTESIRSVNWNLLVLFGVIASVQPVFAGTRVNEWLGAVLVGPLQHLVSAPVLFVAALTLVGVAISFMLRTPTAAPLMTVAFGPVAMAAGIDAWIVALVALVSCTIFIFAYQSNPYQALLQGTGGRLFTDAQTRPLAILYVLLSLIAVCVSVPIWHVMGLL